MSVVIVTAFRTAIGKFNGMFKHYKAHDLTARIFEKIFDTTTIGPDMITEVILGQVLTCLTGQNPARQAAIVAGIPYSVPSFSVNLVCGSGLKSIILATEKILLNPDAIILAGGQENMSMTPHALSLRRKVHTGEMKMIDSLIFDGLTDIYSLQHMGVLSENLSKKYSISREQQDDYAFSSVQKAITAQIEGKFTKEIVSILTTDGISDLDEHIRKDLTRDKLSSLKPAFEKNGTITAGNASGINDGAAACLLMSEINAKKLNIEIRAYIRSWVTIGNDPSMMGIAPVIAIQKALNQINWSLDDVDVFEINEAFSVQIIAVLQELGLTQDKVNLNGGAVALGHPIGASGARLLVTLLHIMEDRNLHKGVVSLCVGGGSGVAICIER
ncbi:MAG: acetyl-CoA C-acetyltransferase [Candidatus Xenolissoclinum pacificiensis L6]|uniref:Acetyl-CoA C-acetyltransferase n=1 Tax=Candidatus Xenolissoclinum pacificiensis L6 TaxID=1401685 RepID=W2UY19_9RICK|nr:MAG: acetyl-CoA C-acetyltransferase [Candidatus Xenolissoclinum pacificiensis L6]